MTTETTLRQLIADAVAAGEITSIDGAEEFDSVEEFLEYCSIIELRDIAEDHGLIARRGRDIHEIMAESARWRARWAGIRGA